MSPHHDSSSSAATTLRYPGIHENAGTFWLAAVAAIGLHAGLLLCCNRHVVRMVALAPPQDVVRIEEFPLPPDEPPVAKPDELPDPAPAVQVPSLPDVPPLVVIDTAIRQLAEPMVIGISTPSTLTSIPVAYRHGPGNGNGPDQAFKPSELDRPPAPISRVPPDYPFELKREGITGNVRIGFIVDGSGAVVSAHVVSSTDRGFEAAALNALAKWKFRPGMKNGRKVRTRMEQLIEFNVAG